MLESVLLLAAEDVVAWQVTASKALMVGLAMIGAAMGLGMLGANYMKALGRNPEAGKVAGQIVIIAAMIEVTALLAFLASIIIS
jgi:F-type H+-transporting ATPase subunit c